MFKITEYLTCIDKSFGQTYYLYDKTQKVVLPIQNYNIEIESIENYVEKIIKSLGGKIYAIKIYLFQEDIYYSYLSIQQGERDMDINIPIKISIKLAKMSKAPIFVDSSILEEQGIKVTKEMLEKALSE